MAPEQADSQEYEAEYWRGLSIPPVDNELADELLGVTEQDSDLPTETSTGKRRPQRSISPPRKRHRITPVVGLMTPQTTESSASRERRHQSVREALSRRISETVNNTPVARLTPPGSWPSLDDRDSPSPDAPAFGPMTPRTPRAVRVVPPMTPMSPEQKLERTKKRAAMIEEKWMHGDGDEPPIPAPIFDAPSAHEAPETPSGSQTGSTDRSQSFSGAGSIHKSASSETLPPQLKTRDGLVFISYEPDLQKSMNLKKLSWAVQYEIARLRTTHSDYCLAAAEYETILSQLSGSNVEARRVPTQLRELLWAQRREGEHQPITTPYLEELRTFVADAERRLRDPLAELDREELALEQGNLSGLGLVDANDPWYGGQVVQVAKLIDKLLLKNVKKSEVIDYNKRYSLKLEKIQLGRSHRVSRLLGSRRVLQVSIHERTINSTENHLREFFSQRFVLNGRIFQAVLAKEKTVHLIETGDLFSSDGLPPSHLTNSGRLSLLEFIRWHNPMEFNKKQGMAKYSARFALAFSTSVPVCRVASENVVNIDDIKAPFEGGGKVPAHLILTDGCGFMNKAVAMKIQDSLGLRIKPTAVQARFGGAKGMFLLHPDTRENMTEDLKLWIRESQTKILHGPGMQDEPSQLTMDLIRPPHLRRPARLSKEVMACLSQGGVRSDAIKELFEAGLKAEYDALTTWEGENAMIKLWDTICSSGRVLYARLRREAAGASRAYGFGEDHDDDDAVDGIDNDAFSESSTPWWPDLVSGLPSGLEETVLAFLVSGFDPNTNPVLRQKIKAIVTTVIDRYVSKYHVGVPFSVEGFAVPDPFGVLKEGEVFCRASEAWQDATGNWRDVIEGPVLATRHPCKVASDVHKFYAVERPELRSFLDVVVFSTKGSRSPMSLLGGGDYDGDTVLLIWQPEIVDDFQNAPECLGDPPDDFIETNFVKEIETVTEFNQRVGDQPIEKKETELQRHLLAALAHTAVVGSYSVMHEKASYTWGYSDPRTIRLAHMFCTCLDGSKSGLVVKPEVRKRDQASLGKFKLPSSRGGTTGFTTSPTEPLQTISRPHTLPPDIIDQLYQAGKAKKGQYKEVLEDRNSNIPRHRDDTLLEPFLNAQQSAQRAHAAGIPQKLMELESIQEVVRQTWAKHRERVQILGVQFSKLSIVERQDILRELSTEHLASLRALDCILFSSNDVPLIAASYAYFYDLEEHNRIVVSSHERHKEYKMNKGSGFAYDIAFRQLAHIKAGKTGTSSTIIREFAERFVLHRASMKLL